MPVAAAPVAAGFKLFAGGTSTTLFTTGVPAFSGFLVSIQTPAAASITLSDVVGNVYYQIFSVVGTTTAFYAFWVPNAIPLTISQGIIYTSSVNQAAQFVYWTVPFGYILDGTTTNSGTGTTATAPSLGVAGTGELEIAIAANNSAFGITIASPYTAFANNFGEGNLHSNLSWAPTTSNISDAVSGTLSSSAWVAGTIVLRTNPSGTGHTPAIVTYGGDDSSIATNNGQIVQGQPYTVWYNSSGTLQVTGALQLWGGSPVISPYQVFSNSQGQVEFQVNDGSQPLWLQAVGDPTGTLTQISPNNLPQRLVALENSPATPLDTTSTDIKPLGASAVAGAIGRGADAGHIHPNTGVQTAVIDTTASDIQALGASAVAGATGKLADAGHVHPNAGVAILDTNASDIKSLGSVPLAGSSGKAADASHMHTLPGGASGVGVTVLSSAEGVICSVPTIPASLAVGSSFLAIVYANFAYAATGNNSTFTVRAGTTGTTSDAAIGTIVNATSTAGGTSSGFLKFEFIIKVATTGSSGTGGLTTTFCANSSGAPYYNSTANPFAFTANTALSAWNTSTSTFLSLTWKCSNASGYSLSISGAFINQVA